MSIPEIYNSAVKKLLWKILLAVILVSIAVGVAVYQPWSRLSFIPFSSYGTALTINVMHGKAAVYLDGSKVGETPYSSENLNPGDYSLTIERMSSNQDFYEPISKQIHLEQNTRTLVEAEIGPGLQFSAVRMIYYKKHTSEQSSIYVKTNPASSTVWIDDVRYGNSPVTNNTLSSGKHDLSVSHDGYEDQETSVIIREGFVLIAEFDLMAKPIELPVE